MPGADVLNLFYSSGYFNFDKWREQGKGMAFAKSLKKWKAKGRLLDIGCATGFFINGIKNNSDWDVYGIEFGKDAVEYARGLGLNVKHGDITNADYPDECFDFIHLNNVLEHVTNPLGMLSECRRIIKKDGKFFLSVPNGYNDSLSLINFYEQEMKPARSKDGHIFFFSKKTLEILFGKTGFRIESKKTYSIKRGLRNTGILSQKKNWKELYSTGTEPESMQESEVKIPETKKHSDFYYKYRFIQGNLMMIPGLHKFGLDFMFMLRPV
jgi:SAM-dependent methyltransferase